MRVVQKTKNNEKPVQEQKMRTGTGALCRSLLAVSEAGEAEPCGGGPAGLQTRTLVFIHDKSLLFAPSDMGQTKQEGRAKEKPAKRSHAAVIRFFGWEGWLR